MRNNVRNQLPERQCEVCDAIFLPYRSNNRFCTQLCAQRAAYRRSRNLDTKNTRERSCRLCRSVFPLVSSADNNRQYCSKQCAKRAWQKQSREFKIQNPRVSAEYRKNQLKKNPDLDTLRTISRRSVILEFLGGCCLICGVTNPSWLHVDYIPTTIGSKYRHPRHIRYIREHPEEFRILCANHHYELTLTGRIAGTDITQPTRRMGV